MNRRKSSFTVAGSAEIHGSSFGAGDIQKLGTGKLYLRGDNSSYAGTIAVESGQLIAGAGDSLGDSTRVVVEQAGSFRLVGDENWGSLSGAGFIDLGSHSATLIENQSTTIAGRVLGSGTLHMTGTGKIRFDTHSNLSSFTGDMSVHSGAIELDGFSISRFDGGMITSGEGIAVFNTRNTNLTYSGSIQNGGRILKTGTGVLELTQNNFGNPAGVVEVRQGTLKASIVPGDTLQLTGGKFESTGSFIVDRIDTSSIGGTLDTGTGNAIVRQALTGAGNLLKQGTGNLELTYGNSDHSGFTGELNVQEGMLRLRTSLNNGRVHLGSQGFLESTSNDMAFSLGGLSGSGAVHVGEASIARSIRVGGLNQDSTFSGSLEGPGSLVKTGTGTLSLTGNNENSWLEVEQGALRLGSNAFGRGVGLANGTTLSLAGNLNSTGTDTLTLRVGDMTIDTGAFSWEHSGALTSTAGTTLVKTGAGTLSFGGTSPLGGALVLREGVVQARPDFGSILLFQGGSFRTTASNHSLTASIRVEQTGSAFDIGAGQTIGLTGSLSGDGELRKIGAGQLQLRGQAYRFRGSLSVEEGSMAIYGQHALPWSTHLNVDSGASTELHNEGTRFAFDGDISGGGFVGLYGDGEFVFNGDASQLEGNLFVSSGTLSGSGTFGNLEIGAATFSPGESPAIIEIENFDLSSTGLLDIELGGLLAGFDYDQLQISGDATIAGMLDVSLIDGFTMEVNQEFLIADIGGTLTGEFQGLSEGSLVGAFNDQDLFITYRAGSGNSIGLFTAVPEPSCLGLCLMVGIAACIRQKRAQL
ncbi:MAG: autotransporter-associated beta strand repeat-containing protein [Aureliella sp.]